MYQSICAMGLLLSKWKSEEWNSGKVSSEVTGVKSRIWTSQRNAGARHWRGADIRSVLPHRPWSRDIRRALDTAHHPQPVHWLRKLQRDPGGRARALPYSSLTAAQAARTARCRDVGTQ